MKALNASPCPVAMGDLLTIGTTSITPPLASSRQERIVHDREGGRVQQPDADVTVEDQPNQA